MWPPLCKIKNSAQKDTTSLIALRYRLAIAARIALSA